MPKDFNADVLSPAWSVLSGSSGRADLEVELQRECSPGHALHGAIARAVAVRTHRKEVIYWLPDREEWAVVHLTWSGETDPRWPSAEFSSTWAGVIAELADRERS